MRIAICQFGVDSRPSANAAAIEEFAERAAGLGARILLAPEASIRPLPLGGQQDAEIYYEELDGPFVESLKQSSADHDLAIVAGTMTPAKDGKAHNTLVVLDRGKLIAAYDKLHLYDAFSDQESSRVAAGTSGATIVGLDGVNFGLATCYDLRFPELFRHLVDRGAEGFLVPAAWVRGPLKEEHWFTLLRARAIENTCYVFASGECGPGSIGRSTAIDPLGLQLGDLGTAPGLQVFQFDRDRLNAVRAMLPVLEHRRLRVSFF